LLDLLTRDEAGFRARFVHSPILRIKRGRFLRNVCVAVGNWGNAAAVPRLIPLLRDPDPVVRGHAAWALGQIGTEEGLMTLSQVYAQEGDERVRQEIAEFLQ
jgi:epoxyqueuosine reductase